MEKYIELTEAKGFWVLKEIDENNYFTAQRMKPMDNGTEVYRKFIYRTCKCGKQEVVQISSKSKVPETCRKCNAYNMGRKNFIENASDRTIYRRKHR